MKSAQPKPVQRLLKVTQLCHPTLSPGGDLLSAGWDVKSSGCLVLTGGKSTLRPLVPSVFLTWAQHTPSGPGVLKGAVSRSRWLDHQVTWEAEASCLCRCPQRPLPSGPRLSPLPSTRRPGTAWYTR